MKLVSGQTLFSKSQEMARKRDGRGGTEREREGERKWVTSADKSKAEEQAGREFHCPLYKQFWLYCCHCC